jgi:hypothetical protein
VPATPGAAAAATATTATRTASTAPKGSLVAVKPQQQQQRRQQHSEHKEAKTKKSLSPFHQDLLNRANASLDIVWKFATSDEGWKVVKNKGGCVVHSRVYEKKKLFRSTGIINCAPEKLIELFADIKNQPAWNTAVQEYACVFRINENTDVTRVVASPVGPVSKRDFYNVRQVRKVPGTLNSYQMAGVGLPEFDKKYPPRKGFVRGINGHGGWTVIEGPGEPNKSTFCWVMDTNLRGWLPGSLVRATLSGVLHQFHVKTLTNHVVKYLAAQQRKQQ